MRKILLIGVLVLILFTVVETTFATLRSDYDFTFSYGSPPVEGFEGAFGGAGFTGGFGEDIVEWDSTILNIRFDTSFFSWKGRSSNYASDVYYTRIPIFVGARLYFKLSKKILPYIEAGPELSFDISANDDFNDTSFGVSGGGGIIIRLRSSFMLGVTFRYHLVNNPYFNVGPVIGTRW